MYFFFTFIELFLQNMFVILLYFIYFDIINMKKTDDYNKCALCIAPQMLHLNVKLKHTPTKIMVTRLWSAFSQGLYKPSRITTAEL